MMLQIISLSLLTAILFLIGSGILYQYVSTKIDVKKYPPLGKIVDIGGLRLHIYCTGTGSKATVILDAGIYNDSTAWSLVQSEIAKFARVCSYDRAGYGWSEKSPNKRTSAQIVKELHALLGAAKISSPYILVGHSFGGANMQLYAKLYPEEVAGLILVDSAHEKALEQFPKEPKRYFSLARFIPLLVRVGVLRVLPKLQPLSAALYKLPPEIQKRIFARINSVKHIKATMQEGMVLKESLAELAKTDHSFGNLPLVVIAAGKPPDFPKIPKVLQEYFEKFYPAWMVLQRDLAARSSQSKLIIAENSNHLIPWQQPEIIVEAVQEMMRDTGSKPCN